MRREWGIRRCGSWFEFTLQREGEVRTWRLPTFDLAQRAQRARKMAGWRQE